jgi:hypothetical protein
MHLKMVRVEPEKEIHLKMVSAEPEEEIHLKMVIAEPEEENAFWFHPDHFKMHFLLLVPH